MNLSCIIIDDEPNAVNLLEILIGQSTEWRLLAKCYNGLEALEFLKTNEVDFIFLDINMPLLSGMDLAALLPPQTKIIFTTAYSEYAAESYLFQTIDYLVKPITLKRFLGAVKKIELYFLKPEPEKSNLPGTVPEYFFVKSGKAIRKILLKNILYFEGEKEYARLVTPQEQLLVYRRLKDIEQQLLPEFIRSHNSYIVKISAITRIEDNHVFIADKRIPIGEKFKNDFLAHIDKKKF
jgi:two-component system, LytTR family, response regulator